MRHRIIYLLWALGLTIGALTGCSTNPVTGKSQLSLINPAQEIQIGKAQYGPGQQSQGGRYTLDPDINAYVNQVGQRLAAASDQPNLPYEFVVLNNSVPNAWALPGGKIAINRGLLVLLKDESQLAAVLGHEIVHAAARHGASQASQGMLLQLGTQIVGAATNSQGYTQLAGLGASAFQARYGRSQELEADHYGIDYMVKVGYDPQGAVELQQTFVALAAKQGSNSGGLAALFASHPPSQARVNANQQKAATLPGGKRNKAVFERNIQQMRKDQAAYDTHDKALKAASKEEWKKALLLTNQAIKKQPREARFWLTKGKLNNREKNLKTALKAFNQAVKLDPDYFEGFLYRGIVSIQQKDYLSAQQDFLASNQRLETQPANYFLGEIARQQNNRDTAINYYRKANKQGGKLGKAAADRLAKMGAR